MVHKESVPILRCLRINEGVGRGGGRGAVNLRASEPCDSCKPWKKREASLNCKYGKNGSLWVCEVLLLEYFAELHMCTQLQNLLKLENSRAPALVL